MAAALILTALGGLYYANYPNYTRLKLLYGYWGFTTIFLFWAPMIKATRLWGGKEKQGRAFGFLDGGRGLVAAAFGSLGVLVFATVTGDNQHVMTFEIKREAFQQVILSSAAIVGVIGVLVFLFLKGQDTDESEIAVKKLHSLSLSNIRQVLKLPSIWLLMVIILCAYTGYKATDYFSLYASTVMRYNDINAAKAGTSLLYLRPVIGVVIGLLADRSRPSLWLIIGFVLTILASLVFSTNLINHQQELLFFLNILLMAIGVYSCRVLYFATLEESSIPFSLTGTAVGLASIVGFTPDIFSGPMFGILVDNPDGVLGLQNAFKVLAGFALIGLIASYLLRQVNTKRLNSPDDLSL